MKSDSQTGYLIIADISGYTAYVAKTEIQNAQAFFQPRLEFVFSLAPPARAGVSTMRMVS